MSDTQAALDSRAPTRLEELSRLLEALPGAILLLDRAGAVRYINAAAQDRLDAPKSEAIGRNLFSEILPELEMAGMGRDYRTAVEEGSVSLSWEGIVGGDARALPVALRVQSFEDDGDRWGVALVEDRSVLAGEIERRRRAERLAAVGELAAGAAHEINNPLASIKGFAQLLARDTLDRGQQQALQVISEECTRVARIVDNLLDFANQQRVVDRESIDLSLLAEEVLTLKRYALETAGIDIEEDLDDSLSPVEGEKGSLQRLILVLINEAERSLIRRESGRQLLVRTRESNDGVVLYVTDNGAGVPRHQLPELLRRPATSETGLGLSSADVVVTEHGGNLWVESAEGRGTTFTVRLPRARRRRDEPEILPGPPVEVSDAPRPSRVLIADDEPTLRMALSMFLERHGYEVEQASNADEAFDLARTGRFDVALVDVRMPGDGIVLLDRLDEEPGWSGRAILMTGDHTHSRVRDEIRRGRPHLTKPFDMMDAVRLVDALRTGGRVPNQRKSSAWKSS
ncbi:MAG: histidine kinase dimerization/phospho-acceptor domain-containing protein [Gemmatimonadota bacterium]